MAKDIRIWRGGLTLSADVFNVVNRQTTRRLFLIKTSITNMAQTTRETARSMSEEMERELPDRESDSMFNRVLQLIERTHRVLGYDTGLRENDSARGQWQHSMIGLESETHSGVVTALLSAGIRTFSGKWKLSILWHLRQRSRRFGELTSLLPGVTSKVLTYQLRELVEAGLISRKLTIAPRQALYALTESGIDAIPLLELLSEWGHRCCTQSGDSPSHER